ncbi:hypothetical protein T492DRAFT_283122 [Pavlovales sp. CCMP2436]|nr:hypothetical protein T492DRAFT_283122 [Pavlovales sp. CCMP2436]
MLRGSTDSREGPVAGAGGTRRHARRGAEPVEESGGVLGAALAPTLAARAGELVQKSAAVQLLGRAGLEGAISQPNQNSQPSIGGLGRLQATGLWCDLLGALWQREGAARLHLARRGGGLSGGLGGGGGLGMGGSLPPPVTLAAWPARRRSSLDGVPDATELQQVLFKKL